MCQSKIGRLLARLPGHRHATVAIAFPADGKLLATGSLWPSIRLWDLGGVSPRERPVLDEKDGGLGAQSLVFSPDGRLVASGRDNGQQTLRIWRIMPDGFKEIAIPRTTAKHVVFSPDGKRLIFSDQEWNIHLWDLTSPIPVERLVLRGHELGGWSGILRALALSPDGRMLASSAQDKRVIVWDTTAGKKLHEWQLPGEVTALAFATDGRHLASGNRNGTIYILRIQ
jgi:WD40 repeat protein